jgi:hypothetical protein
MNIVKKLDQYNEGCVFFCEPIKNNIMNDGNFIRIIYSNELFVLNGIYLTFTIISTSIEKYYNKYKIIFDKPFHSDIIERLRDIEENIIKKINIKNKIPQLKIYEQLKNSHIKIFIDPKHDTFSSNNTFILKISGIWETDMSYGVTYKFIRVV